MKWEKVTKDGVEQETPKVPEAISFIKLMLYDKNRPQDVLAASMYFNTMSSKSQNDSYLDRLVQAKAMVKLYQSNLEANRKNMHDTSTKKSKKLKAGPFTFAEVVTWLGANAELLSDGDQFSKSRVTVGVLVRVACNVSDYMEAFFQGFINSGNSKMKDLVNGVCQQRYMSPQGIWYDGKERRPVQFCLSFAFLPVLLA